MEQKGIKYDSRVYLQWEKKYKMDPVRTRQDLRKINRYHKQYLYILTLTRNVHLINDIYDIMVDKFRYDIYQNQKSKPISTIAKWLPREKSSYDTQLDFINKFTDKMYPGMSKGRAFKLYRTTASELSKKLNITETYIAEKDFAKINFRKVPVVCLRRNMNLFLSHAETKERLLVYLNKKFVDVSDKTYIDYLLNANLHPVEKQICISAFSVRKSDLIKKHLFLNNVGNRRVVPVLDMSSDVFKSGKIYHNILVALITLQYSDNIIINSKEPVLLDIYHKKNISDKVKIIMRNLNESHQVDLEKIKLLTKNELFVISNKPVVGEYKEKVSYWPKKNTNNDKLVTYDIKNIKYVKDMIAQKIIKLSKYMYGLSVILFIGLFGMIMEIYSPYKTLHYILYCIQRLNKFVY